MTVEEYRKQQQRCRQQQQAMQLGTGRRQYPERRHARRASRAREKQSEAQQWPEVPADCKRRSGSSPSSPWPRWTAPFTANASSTSRWSISGSTISTCTPARARSLAAHFLRARRHSPNAMGKFRDLLEARPKVRRCCFTSIIGRASTRSFRAHRSSSRRAPVQPSAAIRFRAAGRLPTPNPQQPSSKKKHDRGLNENYGRELMELHTLGVDGGYTQQDVVEVARAFHRLDNSHAAARSGILFKTAFTIPSRKWCWATRSTPAA